MQFLAELMDNGLLADSFGVTFEQGEYEDNIYSIYISIPCTDPSCNCGIMEFKAIGLPEKGKGEKFHFYLSLETRKPPSDGIWQVQEPNNINFSKAFVHELNESNWDELTSFYYAYKVQLTENLPSISDIKIDFSPTESDIESKGSMIRYQEILPFAQDLTMSIQGKSYIIDDNYCISSRCNCTLTILEFFDTNDLDNERVTSCFVINYNYKKRRVESETNTKDTNPSNREIANIMYSEIPDIQKILKNRHRILRKIYAQYRKQKYDIKKIGTAYQKISRNDQCPCGSGKKYKNCCGF